MPATLTGPLDGGGEQRRAPVSRGSGPWAALRAGDRLRFEERVFTMTGLGHDGRCWMTAAGHRSRTPPPLPGGIRPDAVIPQAAL
jgi:hypothetical protein